MRIRELRIPTGEGRLAAVAADATPGGRVVRSGARFAVSALATDALAAIELRLGQGEAAAAAVAQVVTTIFGVGPGRDAIEVDGTQVDGIVRAALEIIDGHDARQDSSD
jgi:hypothetical protein